LRISKAELYGIAWEAFMPEVLKGSQNTAEKPWHPQCPACAVPMWLVEVKKLGAVERRHFECKVCDSKAVLPAHEDPA
jgi:hypothetical protein